MIGDLARRTNGHINNVDRNKSYRTAPEQPDRCLADRGECWGKAVGLVVFNSSAFRYGLPIHCPLAVCEKHYTNLKLLKDRPGTTIIRELMRYDE